MGRIKAALIHFLISVLVFCIFLSLVFFIWYAPPFHYTQGIAEIVYLMAGVDVILGPLLTLIVFKAGKKSLKLDLSIIAAFQISALIYGAYVIYTERPAWVPFAENDFTVITYGEIKDQSSLAKNLQVGILDKPKFIYIGRPSKEELAEIIQSVMNGGPDQLRMPKYYRAYSNNNGAVFLAAKAFPEHPELKNIDNPNQYKYVPLKGKIKNITVLVDSNSNIVGFEYIDPW